MKTYPKLESEPAAEEEQKTFETLSATGWWPWRGKGRCLLLAEDVHWADPSSLELLDRMIGQLSDLPVLLIVSFRPEFVPPWVEHPMRRTSR